MAKVADYQRFEQGRGKDAEEHRVSTAQREPIDLQRRLLDLVHDAMVADDLEGVLAGLLDGARQLVPCDGVSLMWLDEDHLKVLGRRGLSAALAGLTLPIGQMGAARPAIDGGRCVLVADTAEDPRWQRVPGEELARSWLGVPLLLDGRAVGLVEWVAQQPAQFDEADLSTAAEFAYHVVPVLHQVQLLDDMRRRLRELAELPSGATTQAEDPRRKLQQLVREARECTEARHAFAFLTEEDGGQLTCVAASGDQRERLKLTVLQGDGSLGGLATPRTRSPARLGGRVSDREVLAALGIRNTAILPLRVKSRPVGLLGVAERLDGEPFDQDALRSLTHLSSQASVLLERSVQTMPEPAKPDYEMVVQSSPLAVGLLTLNGEILFSNPGLAELLSRSSRSLVGLNLADFVEANDGRRLTHAMDSVGLNGRHQVDVQLRTALGEQRQVRISLALARTGDEAGGYVVAMLEDITSVKILEQDRVELLRELREQHSRLQELDQLKSRFVSNVSHELRTPLAVIKLYATLARRGRPEKQAHYLLTIEQETHRLERMVENILDLTRLDRRALEMHAEWLSPDEVIAQVLEVYQETASRKGIDLRNEVSEGLPRLLADRNHLIQMLTNLVDNALKYTPRGGQVWVLACQVAVPLEPGVDSPDRLPQPLPEAGPASEGSETRLMLEIAVGDTGAGIAESEQEKVFERFFRGSNNVPGSTGTGLGLAIVQDLMVQHGGRVTLQSRVGEGSVFTLQFPLNSAEVENAETAARG